LVCKGSEIVGDTPYRYFPMSNSSTHSGEILFNNEDISEGEIDEEIRKLIGIAKATGKSLSELESLGYSSVDELTGGVLTRAQFRARSQSFRGASRPIVKKPTARRIVKKK
jgi:hypothetical protein